MDLTPVTSVLRNKIHEEMSNNSSGSDGSVPGVTIAALYSAFARNCCDSPRIKVSDHICNKHGPGRNALQRGSDSPRLGSDVYDDSIHKAYHGTAYPLVGQCVQLGLFQEHTTLMIRPL